jgi:hypothetical protein
MKNDAVHDRIRYRIRNKKQLLRAAKKQLLRAALSVIPVTRNMVHTSKILDWRIYLLFPLMNKSDLCFKIVFVG